MLRACARQAGGHQAGRQVTGPVPVRLGLPGRRAGAEHLADQGKKLRALSVIKPGAPRHPGGKLGLQPLLQVAALAGQDQVLDPAVAGVRRAPGQAPLLQHVRDGRDERRVAVHPAAHFLHRHRGVQDVQRLDEDGRDGQPLRDPVDLADDAPGQLGHAFLDLGVEPPGIRRL